MDNSIFFKTRKSDSKGRLSGFPPDSTFEVRWEAGQFTCTPAEHTKQFVPKPITDAGLEYLAEFGLDPHRIAKDSADDTGYDEFQFDERGNRVYLFGKSYIVRKPWPEGFDWGHFVSVSLEYMDAEK